MTVVNDEGNFTGLQKLRGGLNDFHSVGGQKRSTVMGSAEVFELTETEAADILQTERTRRVCHATVLRPQHHNLIHTALPDDRQTGFHRVFFL